MAQSDDAPCRTGDSVFPTSEPPNPPARLPSARAILTYNWCEQISEFLVYFTVIFSPWAFGTTQTWSIWTMNTAGYALSGLLVAKLIIRHRLGHKSERWRGDTTLDWLIKVLVALTVAILGYILLAAANARAIYDPVRMDFNFRPHLIWLPHSYDWAKTWQTFANYLALAGFFWSVWDWLLGKGARELRAPRSDNPLTNRSRLVPARLRRLLWVLSVNGALLAMVAIAQRLDGGGKLLWLVQPRINKEAISQLGPFAYRANGAQYFNLLWPMALALWWMLRREARRTREIEAQQSYFKSPFLLLAVLVMAVCPIISASRGGAVITFAGLFVAAALIMSGLRRRHPAVKFVSILFFGSVLSVGLYLGWDHLADRLKSAETDLFAREDIYATARGIARDYPVFGTGPGSFESVFQLYRSSTDEYWPAQLHNDWLETLVTFGWVGSVMIALALACVLGRWWRGGGIETGWRFQALIWLALAGCLIHARFDFPLQVYSILHLFLLECAVLFALSRREVPR